MTDLIVTIWPSLANTFGKSGPVTWEQLGSFFNSPSEFAGTFETKGWSCAEFENDKRDLAHLKLAHALCLDFDNTIGIDALRLQLEPFQHFIHSSKSNSANSPRYRAAIATTRPMNASEYYKVWRIFTRDKFRGQCDEQTKDPSRFWFVPCRTGSTLWEFYAGLGASLDVDGLVAQADALDAREEALRASNRQAQSERIRSSSGDIGNLVKRAAAYVDKMDPSISGSHGHVALLSAAVALKRYFMLPDDESLSILETVFNPKCQPPWQRKDLARKLGEAMKASRLKRQDGCLADSNSRDGCYVMPFDVTSTIPEQVITSQYDSPTASIDNPDGVPVEEDSPEVTAMVERASSIQVKEIEKTAAERYGAYSAQRLALDVFSDVCKKKEPGCPTGIGDIDEAIGGIRRQMVGVLGGSTSFGKTTLGMLCANETCKVKRRPLILTFEDAPLLYGRKLVAMRGQLNATAIRDRGLTNRELSVLTKIVSEAEPDAFLVNCIGKTVEYAVNVIRDIVPSEGIEVVIVDYLQRIKTEKRTQDRRNEVTYVAGLLSDAIKEANCGGLMLSQLKRVENGSDPTMSDLKESGDIECFAEFVILGWRNQTPQGNGNLVKEEKFAKLPKNKDGVPLPDAIPLKWNQITASFEPTLPTSKKNDSGYEFDRANADFDNAIGQF